MLIRRIAKTGSCLQWARYLEMFLKIKTLLSQSKTFRVVHMFKDSQQLQKGKTFQEGKNSFKDDFFWLRRVLQNH